MDDLEFRRTIYSDPKCSDRAIKNAAAEDPARQDFWKELRVLEAKLEKASKVDVPEGLANRLILRQSMQDFRQKKTRSRIQFALAASIAFVCGVSFTLWQQQNVVNLSENALAHVYEEGSHALEADENLSIEQVNLKLASYGGQFTQPLGHIYYANFCDFDNIKSLHMVMQGENGKVSVFLIPHKGEYSSEQDFYDDKLHGQSLEYGTASLIMLSDKGKSFEQLKSKFTSSLIFSA
jgi:hypothetical protein